MEDRKLTVADIMKMYGISRDSAMANIFRRQGSGAFKIGRIWFINESDLLKLEKQLQEQKLW